MSKQDIAGKQERPIFTRFSSEFDGPRQYYLDTGEEVPISRFNFEEPKRTMPIWLAHVIWFFLKPISTWLDKHERDEDD